MTSNLPPRHLYWDSCVFIDYLQATPGRIEAIDDVWNEIKQTPGSKIYTSIVSIVEVAHIASEKQHSTLHDEFVTRVDAMWNDRSVLLVIDLNMVITRIARDLIRNAIPRSWALKPYDAIHLATAIWLKRYPSYPISECNTFDSRLVKFQDYINISICEPHPHQPSLGLPNS